MDELTIGELIEPRGNQSLAERFQRMPAEPAWTQPHPLLVAAAIELSDADGVPGGAMLAAAEGILEHLPATGEIPARLAAAQVRLAVSRRIGNLDAAAAAAARVEGLLAEIPASHLARHPEVQAHVLVGRGAVELWSGDLDRAAATLDAASILAPTSGGTYEHSDCQGYLALGGGPAGTSEPCRGAGRPGGRSGREPQRRAGRVHQPGRGCCPSLRSHRTQRTPAGAQLSSNRQTAPCGSPRTGS